MTIRLRADEALATLAADKGGALALDDHVEVVAPARDAATNPHDRERRSVARARPSRSVSRSAEGSARVALRDHGVAFARHLLAHRLGDLAEDRLIPLREQVVVTQHRHDRGDALG